MPQTATFASANDSLRCNRLPSGNESHSSSALPGTPAARPQCTTRIYAPGIARLPQPARDFGRPAWEAPRPRGYSQPAHDRIGGAQRRHGRSQRDEFGMAANFDGLRGTDLDAVVAFPAHADVAVVRLHFFLIQSHQVVGANVLASGLVQCFTPVALFRINVARHYSPFIYSEGPFG